MKEIFQIVNFERRQTNFRVIEYTFFYRQLDFLSEAGVANEILENEPKSYLVL